MRGGPGNAHLLLVDRTGVDWNEPDGDEGDQRNHRNTWEAPPKRLVEYGSGSRIVGELGEAIRLVAGLPSPPALERGLKIRVSAVRFCPWPPSINR
jgi:hypothetical protein